MSYCWSDKKQVKNFAEVFTPAGVVFQMCLQQGIRPVVMDVDKTILAPAVGQGQFPCAELVLKLFFNVDKLNEEIALRALNSLYGVDIQPASVNLARKHLLDTLIDSFKYFTGKDFTLLDDAKAIVNENIIVGDFLKLAKQWTNPQLSLF